MSLAEMTLTRREKPAFPGNVPCRNMLSLKGASCANGLAALLRKTKMDDVRLTEQSTIQSIALLDSR